mmetsp:Transcript_24229/g.67366  ORF Transcript_24229/g.67366 Transcript_24229/m.67366 type:complete len:227 (-) Transcript_24229:117-797(-)
MLRVLQVDLPLEGHNLCEAINACHGPLMRECVPPCVHLDLEGGALCQERHHAAGVEALHCRTQLLPCCAFPPHLIESLDQHCPRGDFGSCLFVRQFGVPKRGLRVTAKGQVPCHTAGESCFLAAHELCHRLNFGLSEVQEPVAEVAEELHESQQLLRLLFRRRKDCCCVLVSAEEFTAPGLVGVGSFSPVGEQANPGTKQQLLPLTGLSGQNDARETGGSPAATTS